MYEQKSDELSTFEEVRLNPDESIDYIGTMKAIRGFPILTSATEEITQEQARSVCEVVDGCNAIDIEFVNEKYGKK